MRHRLAPLLRSELAGLCDQALASGVNFLTLVILARSLGPSKFGFFALAFTLLQSANAVQGALITRPHNVLGALRGGADYVRYTTTAAATQIVFAGGLALLLATGAGAARAAGAGSALVFLAAAPALVAWQLQEFGRRVLYTEGRLAGALANDVLSYGSQAAMLVVLWQHDRLTGPTAFSVVAATSGAGALLAVWQLRRSLSRRVDAAEFRANWDFGKWLGAAELGYWFASQSYIYLAGAIVGAAASGALKASQTLLGPISVFLAFFVNFLPIRFARAVREAGAGALPRQMARGFLATVPVTAAYGLLIAIFARPVLEAVYGSSYGRYETVARLFAAYYLLLSISDVVVASLSARGLTRRIFLGHAAGAIFSLACGWLLLEAFGAAGGVLGMILSLLLAMGLFWSAHAAALGDDSSPTPPAAAPGAVSPPRPAKG